MRSLHRQRWLAVLAVLAAAGLLLAFQQVASDAVRQAEMRHTAALAQHNALWRCNHLPDRARREGCRQRLAPAPTHPVEQRSADPRGGTMRQALNRPDRAGE